MCIIPKLLYIWLCSLLTFFLKKIYFPFGISVFKVSSHPDEKTKQELATKFSVDKKQVQFWFQNKRSISKVMVIYMSYFSSIFMLIEFLCNTYELCCLFRRNRNDIIRECCNKKMKNFAESMLQ